MTRRKIYAVTALLCLVLCGAALAATTAGNRYAVHIVVNHRQGISLSESFTVRNIVPGKLAYPLVHIDATATNVKVANANDFPICSPVEINRVGGKSGKWNALCKPGSAIGSGPIVAELYQNGAQSKFRCRLVVHVYNDGRGKLTFFLTTHPGMCGPLNTGAALAWTATYKQVGARLDLDIPLPPDVSTRAGNLADVWAAIDTETINFRKDNADGQPVITTTARKHAWTMTFTATTNGHNRVKASARGTVFASVH